jgi:hypothetical protein
VITIINETERVISVYNSSINVEIPIGEQLTISNEDIPNEPIRVRYFSSKSLRKDTEMDWINTIGNRVGLHLQFNETYPMETTLHTTDEISVVFRSSSVNIYPIYFVFFKKLKFDFIKDNNSSFLKTTSLVNTRERKRLLSFLVVDLIVSSIMLFLFSGTFFYALYMQEELYLSIICGVIAFLFSCSFVKRLVLILHLKPNKSK